MRVRTRLFLAVLPSLLPAFTPSPAQDHLLFEARTYKSAAVTLPYRVFIPKGYTAARKYPLVLGLHSGTLRGGDNMLQVDSEDFVRPFIADSVQNRLPHFIVMPHSTDNWTSSLDGKGTISPYGAAALAILDSLKREFSIDTARIYVGGFSMGGVAAWVFLKNRPDLFAAAFPCSGAGDPAAASGFIKTPFWAFHGDADVTIPTKGTRDVIAAVEGKGTKVVRFVSQAFIANPSRTAYDDALRSGTKPLDMVAKNPAGISYDSLQRAVSGGADYLYSEVAGGDHRTGWMVAFHHPLLAAWLFSKSKPSNTVSISPRPSGRGAFGRAEAVFGPVSAGADAVYSPLGRRVGVPSRNAPTPVFRLP